MRAERLSSSNGSSDGCSTHGRCSGCASVTSSVLVEGRFADGELRVLPRSSAVEYDKLPREVG